MAEEERLRADGSAFCVAHRLRYDPQLNVGCVLCQRAMFSTSAPVPAAPREGGLVSAVLLGVLGGAVVMLAIELGPPLWTSEDARAVALGPRGLALLPEREAQVSPLTAAQRKVVAERARAAAELHEPPMPQQAPRTGLAGAAARGDVGAIEAALAAHAAIDDVDATGRTPLSWSLAANRPDAARVLLEHGARIDHAGPDGFTPLLLAASKGLESVTALLLERGADPNAVTTAHGASALMLAACGDHAGVVESLLVRHAAVGASDANGCNALCYAACADASAATIDRLLAHGASIEARDNGGGTPLLLAAARGRERSVRALLARGAALDARTPRGLGVVDVVVQPRPDLDPAMTARLAATLHALIESGSKPPLVLDPATTDVLFRPELASWYVLHGLAPLPEFRGMRVSSLPEPVAAQLAAVPAGPKVLDSPATVELLRPVAGGRIEQPAPNATGVLVGYRGWTVVPLIMERVALSGVSIYGEQHATLVGDASGEGEWGVDDTLLLELMQNGQRVDMAFVGRADGMEVGGTPVRRMGDVGSSHLPGNVDLTPWLAQDGSTLVLTALTSWAGYGRVTNVYLRINGTGARKAVANAVVDRGEEGSTQ